MACTNTKAPYISKLPKQEAPLGNNPPKVVHNALATSPLVEVAKDNQIGRSCPTKGAAPNSNLAQAEIQSSFEALLGQPLRPNADGQASARCPFHDDSKPSLSIDLNRGLWKCHAGCGAGTVNDFNLKVAAFNDSNTVRENLPCEAMDVQESGGRKIEQVYPYTDVNGKLVYEVVRYSPKGFAQRRPNGNGGYVWNLKGVQTVPYRLPEVIAANFVLIVEGEKDADRLRSKGFTATTNPGGAGKWSKRFNVFFKGKQVAIIPHNDKAGRAHAEDVLQNLLGVAESVWIVELPGLPEKGDVSDYLDAEHSVGELQNLINDSANSAAPQAKPSLLESIPNIWRLPVPQVQWAITNLLPMGSITLLSGAPGVGKTWYGLAVAMAILQTGSFLDRQASRRTVIYCDLDNPVHVVLKRLHDLGFEEHADFHYWGSHCPVAPPMLEDSRLLVDHIQSMPSPPVVIFDSLLQFHTAEDENSSSMMAPVMAALRLIANAGAAVLVLHHRGKTDKNLYRGSSGIQAGVDLSLMLAPDESGNLLLSTTKNRLAEPFVIAVKLDLRAGGFALVEDPRLEESRKEVELVRSHIASNPGCCQRDVVKALKSEMPTGRVREILKDPNQDRWHARKGPRNSIVYHSGPPPAATETLM